MSKKYQFKINYISWKNKLLRIPMFKKNKLMEKFEAKN